MNRYVQYVSSLGFADVKPLPAKNDPAQIRAFGYESFDPKHVRATLGRAKGHTRDLFVFVLRSGRAVRVDTIRKIVILGNGKGAVKALLRTTHRKD